MSIECDAICELHANRTNPESKTIQLYSHPNPTSTSNDVRHVHAHPKDVLVPRLVSNYLHTLQNPRTISAAPSCLFHQPYIMSLQLVLLTSLCRK